jgi:hypothetical protein
MLLLVGIDAIDRAWVNMMRCGIVPLRRFAIAKLLTTSRC